MGRVAPLRGDEPWRLQDREHPLCRLAEAAERLDEHLGAREVERGPLGRALRARREGREHLRALLRGPGPLARLEGGVETPERLLVLRRLGERLAPERGGAVEPRGVEPETRELRGERASLVAARSRQAALELVRELLLLARPPHARLEGGHRASVVGVERDERLPGAHGLLGLAEVAVHDLRDAAEQRLARLQIVRHGVRGGPVRAGELEERVGARGGSLHRLARRGARRIDRERVGERAERVARAAEPLLLHVGEPLEEPDPLLRLPREGGGELEHPGERRPLARLREQRRERGGGARLGRVGAQRRLEVPAGARGVAEPLLRELRGADAERRVGGLLGRGGEVPLEHGERLGEAARVHVVLERVQRGALAGGVELERLLERGERALRVAEADEVEPRHLEVEQDERGAVAGPGGEPGERVGVAAVIAALAVDPAEEVERERISGRERPGPLHPLDPAREAVGVVRGVELREPELQPRRLAPVLRARGLLLERARLVAPRAGERLEPLARLRRPRRRAVERRRLDERVHREVVLDGLLDERGPEPRILRRERLAVPARVASHVEHPLRLPEATQRREADERARPRLVEGRVEPARAGVQERRAVAPAELLLLELPEAEGHPGRLERVLRGGRLALDGGGERRPVLALPQEVDHRAERFRVRRIGAQELAVELLRPGHVPQLRMREARRFREERSARLVDDARAPLVERDEVLPPGRGLVERLERLERADVARRSLERLEVRADLFVQGGCAQVGSLGGGTLPGKSGDALGV